MTSAADPDPSAEEPILTPFEIDPATGRSSLQTASMRDCLAWIASAHGEVRPTVKAGPASALQSFGLPEHLDGDELQSVGWALLWAPGLREEIKREMRCLLNRRKREAGKKARELDLEVDGAGKIRIKRIEPSFGTIEPAFGTVIPEVLPYYLLIVGDPASVPYDYQHALGRNYAVGRLDLGPDPAPYRRYVQRLLEYQPPPSAPEVALFGPSADLLTATSARELILPLGQELIAQGAHVRTFSGAQATKKKLGGLVGGATTPRILFTASHGLRLACGHTQQRALQGAVLCQDWLGGPTVAPENYFSAEDVAGLGPLGPLLWFAFACFSGGVPHLDDFPLKCHFDAPLPMAPQAFQSMLPTRLLSHEAGPALAFIGHVERVFPTSFQAPASPEDFLECLRRLLLGRRVGHAMRALGDRTAQLAASYLDLRSQYKGSASVPISEADRQLVKAWLAAREARSFILFGDPAVALTVPVSSGRNLPAG